MFWSWKLTALTGAVVLAGGLTFEREVSLSSGTQVWEELVRAGVDETMEIDPADLEIIDGEVIAKGAPQTKLGVSDVAAAATWGHGELITGTVELTGTWPPCSASLMRCSFSLS